MLSLGLVAAALAYVAGIAAARRLGAKVASFVGLTEVLFAVLWAWLLLGQLPAPVQVVGGGVVVLGVALVRVDELRSPPPDEDAEAEVQDPVGTPSPGARTYQSAASGPVPFPSRQEPAPRRQDRVNGCCGPDLLCCSGCTALRTDRRRAMVGGRVGRSRLRSRAVLDVVFLVVTVALFAVLALIVRGAERL